MGVVEAGMQAVTDTAKLNEAKRASRMLFKVTRFYLN
jgi:hypothetical protein